MLYVDAESEVVIGRDRRVDVRHGSVKRVASAVGEGSMAVMYVHRYLAEN